MKLTTKLCAWILLLSCSFSYAQLDSYKYKRELNGVQDTWHRVVLPSEIFANLTPSVSDIRVYGITNRTDTIEAPYLLKLKTDQISQAAVPFKILNTSQNSDGYFFTFEITDNQTISEIDLNFEQENFDWKVELEGSQNQQQWFSIVKDYRILAIDNGLTKFKYTKLDFPAAKYKFFRLKVTNSKKPNLVSAKGFLKTVIPGEFQNYKIKNIALPKEETQGIDELLIDLEAPAAIHKIDLPVSNDFNYYRPITIQYAADSVQTQQGWVLNYKTLTSGTLNSLEENSFTFRPTIVKKLKIVIKNGNNIPLNFEKIEVHGPIYELITRLTEPANYVIAYGKEGAKKPTYDIARFTNMIPKQTTALTLGIEQNISKQVSKQSPLFENKIWLWVIMGLIILLLGGFSLRMLRKG